MRDFPNFEAIFSTDENLGRLIVKDISDGVYLLDRNRIIRYWNRGGRNADRLMYQSKNKGKKCITFE